MKYYKMTASTSRRALEYAEKVLPKLGKITQVVATRYTSPQTSRWRENGKIVKSTTTTWREYLYVYGENGVARFKGVCWGYSGEGPRTVHKILLKCGFPEQTAKMLAFESKRSDVDGPSWKWSPPSAYH